MVAVASRTVGTSQGPSPSTSPSSLSDESWSSSHGAYRGAKQETQRLRCLQRHSKTDGDIQLLRVTVHLGVSSGDRCATGHYVANFFSLLHKIPGCSSRNAAKRRGQFKDTHTDIWWWLGGRKLHHVAPDVSCLVPRGCGNISTRSIQVYRRGSAGDLRRRRSNAHKHN